LRRVYVLKEGRSAQRSDQAIPRFSAREQREALRPTKEEVAVAKTNRDKDLFKMMRAAGVRRKVAAEVSDAVGRNLGPGEKAPKVARQAVRDFSALAARLEDRVSAGTPKRAATAQKPTPTRKRPAEPQRKGGQRAPRAPAA
jgi:hypothetical protein